MLIHNALGHKGFALNLDCAKNVLLMEFIDDYELDQELQIYCVHGFNVDLKFYPKFRRILSFCILQIYAFSFQRSEANYFLNLDIFVKITIALVSNFLISEQV